jgi:thymidylate synthase
MKYKNEDGSLFSKEEFLQKLKKDKEFNDEFGNKYIDQIQNLIDDLKNNPDSRRLMVNAWNSTELKNMVLPPCHYGFQIYTRELTEDERLNLGNKQTIIDDVNSFSNFNNRTVTDFLDELNVPKRTISLLWNQRSCDFPLGIPFNITSYGLLLEIISKIVNMIPGELIGNLGDCHIYLNQIEGCKTQIIRESYELPKLKHLKTDVFYTTLSEDLSLFNHLNLDDFIVENYKSHPLIKFPLSN